MAEVWNEGLRRTLRVICDTFIPALEEQEPAAKARNNIAEYLGRTAGDLNADLALPGLIDAVIPGGAARAARAVVQRLSVSGFNDADLAARTRVLNDLSDSDPSAKHGLRTIRKLAMLVFYGAPAAPTWTNPNWAAIGYPGPPGAGERATGDRLTLTQPAEGEVLAADACVVGSGAGGSVIASELAAAGLKVIVLEQGAYIPSSEFDQRELLGYQNLWLNAGLAATEDGSLAFLAGSSVGGGTTINFMVSLQPPSDIRKEWAESGLDGVDTADFDEDLAAVTARLGVNIDGTVHNRTNQLLVAGVQALGRTTTTLPRNCGEGDDPESCGFCAWGCRDGAKLSADKTWLADAIGHGAQVVARAHADQIITRAGRAAGVLATVAQPDGRKATVRVDAPTVIVAAGALNSPALLLRSGIGGPAVGHHLRVQPIFTVNGIYPELVEGWRGQIMSAADASFARTEARHGFMIETLGIFPASLAASLPWADGSQHKQLMRQLPNMAPLVAVVRDHGSGTVTVDSQGRAQAHWKLNHPDDRAMAALAQQELAKIHHAAGAHTIQTLHQKPTEWHIGEPFDAFLDELRRAPHEANDLVVSSAHPQGSCRLGSDSFTSVADGDGQLHDIPGVWIGDGSGFPSAVGVNPMITIMAMARRTARAIVAAG